MTGWRGNEVFVANLGHGLSIYSLNLCIDHFPYLTRDFFFFFSNLKKKSKRNTCIRPQSGYFPNLINLLIPFPQRQPTHFSVCLKKKKKKRCSSSDATSQICFRSGVVRNGRSGGSDGFEQRRQRRPDRQVARCRLPADGPCARSLGAGC